jgi:hypothetical protein
VAAKEEETVIVKAKTAAAIARMSVSENGRRFLYGDS